MISSGNVDRPLYGQNQYWLGLLTIMMDVHLEMSLRIPLTASLVLLKYLVLPVKASFILLKDPWYHL